MNKICVRCGMEYPDHKMSCKIPVEEWRLPTAEELILKKLTVYNNLISIENAVKLMNLYAKLHVEAQKEAILENVKTIVISDWEVIIDKNSIKNAYPLNNVK
jgi:hypothetical protein